MTFVYEDTNIELEFTGTHRLSGLHVTLKEVNIHKVLNVLETLNKLKNMTMGNTDNLSPDRVLTITKPWNELREKFASILISWNMQRREHNELINVPCDIDGLNILSDDIFLLLVNEWLEHAGGFAKDSPLVMPSNPLLREIPVLTNHGS